MAASVSSAKRPPAARDDPHVRTLLLQAFAKQDQSAFKIVFPLGQAQPGIHPNRPIRELTPPFVVVLPKESPQNAARHIADQVFAVDEDAIVGMIVAEASRAPGALRGRRNP